MTNKEFVENRINDFKVVSLQKAYNLLRKEKQSLLNLYDLSNKIFKRNQSPLLNNLRITSELDSYELFATRQGKKITFNFQLWTKLSNEIINNLREDRKSFKLDNIETVKQYFIESLDFEAIYKEKNDVVRLLFQAYDHFKVDEIKEENDINFILELERIGSRGYRIKEIFGMQEYIEPIVKKPSRFFWN